MNRTQLDHDREEHDSLDRALDALSQGDRTGLERLDPEARATVDHLFAWAAIGGLDEARPKATAASRRRGPVPMDTAIQRPAPVVPTVPKASRRIAPALWSAFAWLMIAAVAGASIYGALPYLRDGQPADATFGSLQPGPATPEDATLTTSPINYGGTPGRSWDFGDTEPLTTGLDIPGAIGPSLQVMGKPLVVGNSIIATMFDVTNTEGNAFQTVRYDLVTGKVMWTANLSLTGLFATDGRLVYGVMSIDEDDGLASGPAAIDLATGRTFMQIRLWEGNETGTAAPVIFDGVAYFTDGAGAVAAVKSGARDLLWGVGMQPASPATPSPIVNTGMAPGGDLVVTSDGVFVERPSLTVARLDRLTGMETAQFNVVDVLRQGVSDISLQAAGNKLVIGAWLRTGPDEVSATPMSVLVYGADSIEFFARADVPSVTSNLVVTREWIYVLGQRDADGPVRLYRIDPVTGAISDPVSDFARPAGSWFGLSLGGTTLMLVGTPGEIAFIDVAEQALIDEEVPDLPEGDLLTVFPLQLWGDVPITVSSGGAIVVIGDTPEGS